MARLSNRSSKGLVNRPVIVVNSHLQGLTVYSKLFGPLTNGKGFSFVSELSGPRGVKALERRVLP